METINELRRIGGLTPSQLTPEDKAFIKAKAVEHGQDFAPKSACKSCYIDMAILLYKLLTDEANAEAKAEAKEDAPKWILKEGVDVVWRNIRINKHTITDAKAEQYVKSGFPTRFFI